MACAFARLELGLKRLDLSDRLIRRNPLYYEPTRRALDRLQRSPLPERVAWTQARLQLVLEAARRTPYGARVPASHGAAGWPFLHKEDVRAEPEAFQTTGAWRGTRASTGGTTGTPLSLIRSASAIVTEQVCIDAMMRKLGADPVTARVAVLRADSVKDASDPRPPFWIRSVGGRRLILSSGHLTAQTLDLYLQELHGFDPDLLWVHPTMLEVLCRLLAQSGRMIRIARVLTSSEMLLPEVWSLARSLLGCAIVDYYGQAERVAFAYAADPGEYFFLPGYAHVELTPHSREGAKVFYEIVGTPLWNMAMPLVRYCTGDLALVPPDCDAVQLEEIVHGVRPFLGVVGRSQDVLLAPNGRGVIPGVSHIARDTPHLLRLQIVQHEPAHISLRVLAAPGFDDADAERIVRNARARMPPPTRIELELVDSLARTSRGKTPLVIHSPAVRDALRAIGLSDPSR